MNHKPPLYASETNSAANNAVDTNTASLAVRSRRRSWLYRAGVALLVAYFIVGAAFLIFRHVILPDLERWRPQVENLVGRYTGHPVSITELRGEISGFSPAVSAGTVRIAHADGQELFSATGVKIALNWRTLIRATPTFDMLSATQLKMRIDRVAENRLQIAGIDFNLPELTGLQSLVPKSRRRSLQRWQLPEWLMAHQGFRLEDVNLDYHDLETGSSMSVMGMSVQTNERDGKRDLLIDVPRFSDQNGSLQVRATLGRSPAAGPLTSPEWHGDAWLKVTDFDSSQIGRLLRQPFLLKRGHFGAQAWFTLSRSAPSNARLNIGAGDVMLQVGDAQAEFISAGAQVDAVWAKDGSVRLAVSHAQATDREGNQVTVDDSEHSVTFDSSLIPVQARFSLQAFDARRFHQFAMGLPIPTDMHSQFARLALQGKVDSLQMQYDARNGPTRFNIDARFERLGIAYDDPNLSRSTTEWAPRLPSAENVSGEVSINETEGRANLHGANVALSFPGVFAEPRIDFDRLHTDITWKVGPTALPAGVNGSQRPDVRVRIERLTFANSDAQGSISGTFQTAVKGPGVFDLKGKLDRANANRVYRYLPLKMTSKVRDWMKEAFVSGSSTDVRLVLKGDLVDFPFRDPKRGNFLVDAWVDDGRFRYAPRWPVINGMQARVRLDRGGLEVNSRKGRIYDVRLNETTARIADFRNAVLKLEGTATGAAQQMIRYVNESPIGRRTNGFTRNTRVSGEAVTELTLTLPFKNFDDFTVTGATTIKGSRVLLADFLPPMTKVDGRLQFTEAGIGIENMSVRMLGGKARVVASSPKREVTELSVTGRASGDGLKAFNDNPLTRSLKGAAGYRARITIRRGIPTVVIESNLDGLEVGLPPPMYKRAKGPLALIVKLRPLGDTQGGLQADELTVSIPEDKLQAVVRRKRVGDGQFTVTRGVLSIGEEGKPELPRSGLKLAVSGMPVNADRWLGFWSKDSAANPSKGDGRIAKTGYFAGFDLLPSEITLVVPSARYLSKRFHDVVLGASREQKNWSVSLSTKEANGFVSYDGGSKTAGDLLTARFSRLNIPQNEFTSFERMLTERPGALPAMDVTAEQFTLHERPLGRLRLRAQNRAGAWLIDELSLTHREARFAASGQWGAGAGKPSKTSLNFDLDITNSGELLTDMGMPGTIRGGAGKINGRLNWNGSPFGLDAPSLSGDMSIALGRGQFLKTEPGIAKLIGVLSLQALPRRLTLDFSDVFENGFTFDAIVGGVSVSNGIAKTESLLMHGIQAEVLINGEADIGRETQNLRVKVAPHINAGIASLAYAALANPAVGLTTLLAQIILEKPLQEIFAHEFAVTGDWTNPTVVQIDRHEDEDSEMSETYTPG